MACCIRQALSYRNLIIALHSGRVGARAHAWVSHVKNLIVTHTIECTGDHLRKHTASELPQITFAFKLDALIKIYEQSNWLFMAVLMASLNKWLICDSHSTRENSQRTLTMSFQDEPIELFISGILMIWKMLWFKRHSRIIIAKCCKNLIIDTGVGEPDQREQGCCNRNSSTVFWLQINSSPAAQNFDSAGKRVVRALCKLNNCRKTIERYF